MGASVAGRGRSLPVMKVLTLPIQKTSTCLTLPLPPDLTLFCRLDGQVPDGDHRPHPGPREDGPDEAVGHCRGTLQAGLKNWLQDRPQAWRDGVEVVAMDRFKKFKTTGSDELPDTFPVDALLPCVRLAVRTRPVPATHPTAHQWPPRAARGPALPGPPDTNYRRGPAR